MAPEPSTLPAEDDAAEDVAGHDENSAEEVELMKDVDSVTSQSLADDDLITEANASGLRPGAPDNDKGKKTADVTEEPKAKVPFSQCAPLTCESQSLSMASSLPLWSRSKQSRWN